MSGWGLQEGVSRIFWKGGKNIATRKKNGSEPAIRTKNSTMQEGGSK
jgi:hypothetical protein